MRRAFRLPTLLIPTPATSLFAPFYFLETVGLPRIITRVAVMPGGLHPTLAVLASWPSTPSPHPVTRGWGFPALIIILYLLAALAVGGRMVARFVYMRNGGVDDVCIILSFVSFLSLSHSLNADRCA